jgi:hypothetical protein
MASAPLIPVSRLPLVADAVRFGDRRSAATLAVSRHSRAGATVVTACLEFITIRQLILSDLSD